VAEGQSSPHGVPPPRAERARERHQEAAGMMVPLNDVAERATAPSLGGLSNEALQQTRSAFTSIAAALAAERWCSTDTLRSVLV
jgi:hypothetical protein